MDVRIDWYDRSIVATFFVSPDVSNTVLAWHVLIDLDMIPKEFPLSVRISGRESRSPIHDPDPDDNIICNTTQVTTDSATTKVIAATQQDSSYQAITSKSYADVTKLRLGRLQRTFAPACKSVYRKMSEKETDNAMKKRQDNQEKTEEAYNVRSRRLRLLKVGERVWIHNHVDKTWTRSGVVKQILTTDVIIEGKTKKVFALSGDDKHVLLQSKDCITAFNNVRRDELEGKAAISTATTCKVFEILKSAGIRTHFVEKHGDSAFIGKRCAMIPIEWVTRRVATGSFLRRNPGVKEGYKFSPVKLETFYKDDEKDDPQMSYEQLLASEINCAGQVIGKDEIDIMSKTTVAVFEVLERYWASRNCALIDMKIEFGIDSTGVILLGDVIDSDSWRLWPSGDKRLMKDKQVYRDMKNVTEESLQQVKRNFEWVSEQLDYLNPLPSGRVVIMMGSSADEKHCEEIKLGLQRYGVPCDMRVCSAHKTTEKSLEILAQYEGDGIPTVFIAVAGMSNGLGPVLSGNSSYPVINCPPVGADWASQDIWSSLRMPSGLGCTTVISSKGAALAAAQILGMTDHVIWSKLRVTKLSTAISLSVADKKLRN
ncbi:Multifunctional protein ADE2 [Nymphon striatum]|nr:Multifunctional protein ADE2 [Nymphon striatum]